MARNTLPVALLAAAARRRVPASQRVIAGSALLGLWTAVYTRYRRAGIATTQRERELLATATTEAYARHYNERVPTVEEEFDIWGEYHQHRHEMRYDLVGDAVRRALPSGGSVLDVGCGSALVADRILGADAHYVGIEFGGHQMTYGAKRLRDLDTALDASFVQGDALKLPYRDASFDVVVMSEVIEHLLQPELAVWEVARVLRPGGVFVMTTNNASEVPLRSPLSHLFAWLEKAIGATRPQLISLRPWVWPWPVDADLLPPGWGPVYLPHTHHIQGETARMFAAAGMDTVTWSTFEFPPPQSATARALEHAGVVGRRAVDVIEAVARRTPVVRRLGCHLMIVARKTRPQLSATPPPGIWPGPFSEQPAA